MKQQKCKNKQDSAITNKSDLQSTCNSSFALFKNCVKKISIPHEKKIKQKDYLSQGTIPVIDQGETFIGGYTNDANTILKCPFPVIVFGDHTKTIKLVNFDFAPGADGIKVLKPTEQYDIRFFFYAMQYVTGKMQDRGYSRNYQYLEKELIPTFSLPEQKRIVEKIDELFSDLDAAESELQIAKEKLNIYKQQIIDSAFIGNNFDYKKLSDVIVANPRNGFSPKGVTYETPYKNLTLSATTSGRFKENCFKYIDQEIATDSHLWVKHDDILIQRANTLDYVGTATVYPGIDNKYVYPDIMMKFHTKDDYLPWFICYQLQSSPIRRYYKDHATGTAGNMPKINQRTVNNTPICICNKRLQQAIISSIEKKISACENLYNLR